MPASLPVDQPPLPGWLLRRMQLAGGCVSFRTYMEWVLHDPEYGAYGAGRLAIGPHGDFATAPSLGPDFAALLLPQIRQWLRQLDDGGRLALIETGPGEGTLALQLARDLVHQDPDLAARCELVLVEPNPGMAERQRRLLRELPLERRWITLDPAEGPPLRGVVLAHEVLDALAVERIVWDGACFRQQLVCLEAGRLRLAAGEPFAAAELDRLAPAALLQGADRFAGGVRPVGWCTELHPGLEPWLRSCGDLVTDAVLLVIDYAHPAVRYYAPQRSDGTLMVYSQQSSGHDPLLEPGACDITAHLCLESLERAARASSWRPLGQRRQGEALLALGLAQRLHALQQEAGADLGDLLARRESLLRLVDPALLGDFHWVALAHGDFRPAPSMFLEEPS
ncbi:MAG: SAM-dependent methyltransferase [Synechococcaceae cyanobacterium]|nr:SAM-dependent methyltransferase [Synechococcaceae cyanobacterium]